MLSGAVTSVVTSTLLVVCTPSDVRSTKKPKHDAMNEIIAYDATCNDDENDDCRLPSNGLFLLPERIAFWGSHTGTVPYWYSNSNIAQ
jgi:hypothetical protein